MVIEAVLPGSVLYLAIGQRRNQKQLQQNEDMKPVHIRFWVMLFSFPHSQGLSYYRNANHAIVYW